MSRLASVQKGVAVRPPRIILLGEPKVGKSTFASQAPAPIFIQVKGEEGIDDIGVDRFPAAMSWEDVLGNLGALATEDHGYESVAIDSASTLERLIWASLCKDYHCDSIEKIDGGYGKGYVAALNEWNRLTEALDYLRNTKGMTTIIIGHVRVKAVNDPLQDPYDSYRFDIHDKASELLTRWSDCVLFAARPLAIRSLEKKQKKDANGKVVPVGESPLLYTRNHPGRPGGGRGVYGHLPPEMPLRWRAFQDAIDEMLTAKEAFQ